MAGILAALAMIFGFGILFTLMTAPKSLAGHVEEPTENQKMCMRALKNSSTRFIKED